MQAGGSQVGVDFDHVCRGRDGDFQTGGLACAHQVNCTWNMVSISVS